MKKSKIVIEAYDPGLGDEDYPIIVFLHNEEVLNYGAQNCAGYFTPAEKGNNVAEIHIGSHKNIGTIAHECLHAAMDLIRKACHTNVGELLIDETKGRDIETRSVFGEEVITNTFQQIFINVLEALK